MALPQSNDEKALAMSDSSKKKCSSVFENQSENQQRRHRSGFFTPIICSAVPTAKLHMTGRSPFLGTGVHLLLGKSKYLRCPVFVFVCQQEYCPTGVHLWYPSAVLSTGILSISHVTVCINQSEEQFSCSNIYSYVSRILGCVEYCPRHSIQILFQLQPKTTCRIIMIMIYMLPSLLL